MRRLAAFFVLLIASSAFAEKTHKLSVQVTGDGLKAVRASLMNAKKQGYGPKDARLRKTTKGVSYFYAPTKFSLNLPPGKYTLAIAAGFEYVPVSLTLNLPGDESLSIKLRRWSNTTKSGWYAGDSHVHLHTGGPIQVTTRNALLAARAEGIHYVNLCVSNNVGDDIRDAELITGKPHKDSTNNHLLVFGEEMRSMIYGHMQFFGISKFVEPQYTGFKNTPNKYDYPANYVMAANATKQGGVVTYGHPLFKGKPIPFDKNLTADNAAARELPIDAILGVCHAVDLMCYNSDEDLSTELWYKLLNCGIPLAASVGTDALLDRSTNPMGGSRVYVNVRGKLTQKTWLDGLRKGRTFVTNGPMVQISVNGTGPGETLNLPVGRHTVAVKATIKSLVPVDKVVFVKNGQPAATAKNNLISKPGKAQTFSFTVKLSADKSSWFAVRVHGPDHADVFDGPVFAHTGAAFVKVGGKPIRSKTDAAYFVAWIDQLMRVVRVRNGYKTKEDRDKVLAIFQRARAKFAALAK